MKNRKLKAKQLRLQRFFRFSFGFFKFVYKDMISDFR